MKILGIETSCDETAVCVLEALGDITSPRFEVLGDALYSQVKTHASFGGVFPALAKREHAKNLVPLLTKSLEQAGLYKKLENNNLDQELLEKLEKILERETGLFETTKTLLENIEKPDIDYISVTAGPGLEPALWVGISFAQALGKAWNIPVLATNHMEGHIVSPLIRHSTSIQFPALALLISGGHTELVLINNWLDYKVIGQTRDDAVGEAFDKVARLLGLPYPGGPEISKLAALARTAHTTPAVKLPRPMLKSDDFDFSFSGIKTSVLYSLQGQNLNKQKNKEENYLQEIPEQTKQEYALEFENAVTEVLVEKTKKALEEFQIKTLILGGGVVANGYIRENFKNLIKQEYPEVSLLIPEVKDSTDNAVMIAAAGYVNILSGAKPQEVIKAQGNLGL